MEVLEQRLRGRGTEAEEKIQRRLTNARVELSASQEPGFVSKVIVNKELDTAVGELEAAVAAHLPELIIQAVDSEGVAVALPPGCTVEAETSGFGATGGVCCQILRENS